MELESLKYIWQQQEMPPPGEPNREEWRALLQKRSEGPVSRMRRNLRREAIVLFISYVPVILWYWFDFGSRLSAISWIFLGLLILFGVYYYRKDRLLRKMLCVSCEVRSNLQQQVTTLKKFVRFYLWTSTAMVPLVFVFMYWLIRHQFPAKGMGNPYLLLILLMLFAVGFYFFNARYVNKLYGRHIKKLQELLQEMDAE